MRGGNPSGTGAPAPPLEVDAPACIESDTLGLQAHSLVQVGAHFSSSAEKPTSIDDSMPRNTTPLRQCVKGVTHLTSLAG